LKSNNSKQVCNAVNDSIGRRIAQKLIIKDDLNNEHDDPSILADMFISFFVGKIESLDLLCPVQREDVAFDGVTHEIIFSEHEVKGALSGIKYSKAQGLDEIPSCVLRDLDDIITLHLTWLFNTVLYTGVVPRSWKISRILPVFKKGCDKTISNYRPVSNISSISKVFERALLTKMEGLLDNEAINGPIQHGFLAGSSTLTAALTIHDYVACEMDKGNVVLMYYADLSVAFDMLRADILLRISEK